MYHGKIYICYRLDFSILEYNMNMSSEDFFQCPECGLHYLDQQMAKKCETFCREFQGCNLDITQHSIERKKLVGNSQSE